MTRAVEVRLELCAVFGDDAAIGEAKHLKAAAVRQDRPVPADEMMQAPTSRDQLVAGPQEKVIGVAENDLGTAVDEVAVECGFHRPLRANGHERRSLNHAMRRLELAQSRRAIGGAKCEAKRRALSVVEGASQRDYYCSRALGSRLWAFGSLERLKPKV